MADEGREWINEATRRDENAPAMEPDEVIAAALIAIAEELHTINNSRRHRAARRVVQARVVVPDEFSATLKRIEKELKRLRDDGQAHLQ